MSTPRNNRAIYPGTFDPITRGHEDIARRAAGLFAEVIVAVADNASKKSFFSLEERVAMVAEALADCSNVRVTSFSGLLVQFMQAQQAGVVLRGLRAVSDFEYEFQLAGMNRRLDAGIETLFLTPAEQYMFISASMVREIALLGGEVAQFVPAAVERRLKSKLRRG